MTEYNLHTLRLVGDTQSRAESNAKRNNAIAAALTDQPVVEGVGSDPGQQTFRGQFRGNDSEAMMTEVVELTENNAPDYEAVPLYGNDTATDEDGYYSLSDVRPQQPRPTTRRFWTYTLGLRKKGTPKTHKRAVETAITALNTSPPTNPFGTNDTVEVAIPNASSKVRWFDAENKSYEAASPTRTDETQFGSVDVFNTSSPTFTNPTLTYELALSEEGKTDLRVWDTKGSASRTSGGLLKWQRVFDPGHNFTGDAVVENGHLRLTFNESAPSLSAEEWNETASDYDAVSLGASNEQLDDLDLERIGQQRVEAQVVFFNTSDSSRYHTEFDLKKGYNTTLITVPENEDASAFPAGLDTKLSPIASGLDDDPAAVKTLVRREKTRL